MPNLLDSHNKKMKHIIKKYSRTVVFTDKAGTAYEPVLVIWNDVEHGLKMEGFENDPMGNKSSIFIDTDTLNTLGYLPGDDWKMTGSPNDYVPSQDYFIEIPKNDDQLTGKLFFISKDQGTDAGWNKGNIINGTI